LTDGSIAQEEKRRTILDAAVRVFARSGYHGARVGDIAREAGVAHGLLYHYFSSKEQVLHTIFRENWADLLQRFRAVEAASEPADQKIEAISKILLRTWRNDRDLVTVMVREVARSPELQAEVEEVREVFQILQRIVEQGQADGTFRTDVDARFASWVVYGGLEEVLTGWVLGGLPDGDDAVARAERTVTDLARRGLGHS
jgi:TetR/AcrR family fatty acid metabolism transcriptional regulator